MCLRASTLLRMRGLPLLSSKGRRESASDAPHIRGTATMISLITADERTRLLSNGQARAAGQDTDPLPVACHLAADFARPSRWRYRPRPDRPGDWHACAGHCEGFRSGRHRRAARAARDAGSLLPAGAAAVGISSVGRRQRLDHRLSATAKRGALCLFRSGL